MAYVREKVIKGYRYWYLVESRREGGKVRSVNLAYLGAAPRVYQVNVKALVGDDGHDEPEVSTMPGTIEALTTYLQIFATVSVDERSRRSQHRRSKAPYTPAVSFERYRRGVSVVLQNFNREQLSEVTEPEWNSIERGLAVTPYRPRT